MARDKLDLSKLRLETRLALAGRDPSRSEGGVNPPVQRATTLLIDDADDLYNTPKKTYGLDGMAVQEALKEALVAIEGGAGATLAPSGLAACTLALLTAARPGGELLVTDALYAPTRRFCDTTLKRMGVRTRYVDPRIGAAIAELITSDTCGIFLESPGSTDVRGPGRARHHEGRANQRHACDRRQHLVGRNLLQAVRAWRRHFRPGADEIPSRSR